MGHGGKQELINLPWRLLKIIIENYWFNDDDLSCVYFEVIVSVNKQLSGLSRFEIICYQVEFLLHGFYII